MTNKEKQFLIQFLNYLSKTKNHEWLTDRCADTEKLTKCCVMGHLYKYAAGKNKDERRANDIWNWFEENIATTYMIFPVNDGKNLRYKQKTPKERCIAYLQDITNGKEKTTHDYIMRFK